MPDIIRGTRAELELVAQADATAHGYPLRGYHIGAGPHAPISDAPGGTGWSTSRLAVRNLERGGLALDVDAELEQVPARLSATDPGRAATVAGLLARREPEAAAELELELIRER